MEIELEAAQTLFLEAGENRTEHIGDSEAAGFIVELK